jgi:transposase
VGKDRTIETVHEFFDEFGKDRTEKLKFVCSDMWKPFIDIIRRRAPQALHVLDRFHIVSFLNRAIDQVRAQEVKELKRKGVEPILKRTRWCLLKRPENRTDAQNVRLAELLQYNLKIVRSFLLKEDFQFFWEYTSPHWAGLFLDNWCSRTMRSKIEPMKKVARMLRAHRELLLNWFRARKQISSGVVEGFNNKAKLTTRKAYGFRTFRTIQVALYHNLGALPEPEMPHRFC